MSSFEWHLGIISDWMNQQMQQRLMHLGLSLKDFAIIMTLLEDEGITQVEIGQRVMLPGYATTRHIDKLESQGYLKRHRHETSRRAYRIMLTEEGRALAPELYLVTQSVNEQFLATLGEHQNVELLASLALVAGNLGLYPND